MIVEQSALALADEHGLAAVTMRAVATRVGVSPMALYPHVGGKDGLLDGIVDRMLAWDAEYEADLADPRLLIRTRWGGPSTP